MCFSEQTESIENFAMGNHPFDMQRESSNSDLKNPYLSTLNEVNDNVILHSPGVRARTEIDTEADMSSDVFKPYVGEGILSPNREMVTALVKDVVTAYPSFVRAIQKRCLGPSGRMALPVMFISTYLSGSEGCVTLEDGDGLLWEVEWIAYVQSGRRLTLTIGWPEFASYHNIKVGNALLVEILSFERFRVQIINTSDGAGRPYLKFNQVNKDLVMAGSNKIPLVRGIKEKPTILDDADVNFDQWPTALGASKLKVHKQLFSNSIQVKKRKWIWNANSKEIQVKDRPEVKKNSVSRKNIFLHSEKIKAGEIKGAGRNMLKKRKMEALASFIEEKNTCPGNTIKIPQRAFVEADETCFMNGKVEDIANLSDKARVTLLKSSNCSLNRNPQHPQDKDVLQGSYLMFKPDLERKTLSHENVIVRPASASIKEKPVSVWHLKQIFNKEHTYQAQYCHSSKEKCIHYVLHGFKFCMLHILEDPFAPYRQCEFVEIENKARCYFPVYMNSTHVSFCQMHRQAGDMSGTEKYSRDFSKLGSLSLLVLASTVAHIPSQEAEFISFDSQPEHPSSYNASITEQLPMLDALYPSVKMANEGHQNLHESNSNLMAKILSKHSLSDKVHKQSHYHSQENDENKHLTRNVRFPFKDASQTEPLKRSSIGQQIPDGIMEASIGKDHTAEWRVTTHFPGHNRLNVTAEKDNKYSCSTLGFIPSSKASQLHTFGCLVDIGKIDFTRTSLLWTPSHLLNLCGFTENNAIDENAYLQTAPRIVLGTTDASTMEPRFSFDEPKAGSVWADKGCHKIQQTDAVALQYQGRRACCSKFVGVRKRPWGAYGAEIRTPEGKRLWLGTFATEEAAARAYDDAARIFKGDGAVTNFECHDTQHDMHSLMLGDHNLTAVKKDDAIFKEMPKKQRSANGKRKQTILLNRQNDIVDQIPNWQDNETTIMQSDCNASALPEPCGYCDWETSAAISCELNMATEVDGLCKNDMQYSTQSIDKVREIKSLTSRPTLESDPGQKVIKMSDLKFVGTSGQLKRKSSNEGRNGRMFEDKFAVCELNEDESQVGGMVQKDNGSSQYSAVPRVVGMQSIYVPSESCIDRERVGEQFDITQENSKQKVVIRGNMNYERHMVKEANRKDYISDEQSIEKDILFAGVRIPASRKHETNIDHRNNSGKSYTSTFKNTEMSPQTCSNGTAEKIHLDRFQSMPCSSRVEDKHYGEVILSNQATENGGHYMLDNVAFDSSVGSEAVAQQNDLLSRKVGESGKLSNVNDDANALHSSIRLSRSANVAKVQKASKSSAPGKANYKRRVEYKGVYCNGRKFQAIYYNPTAKKHIYLGTYTTAEAAARAYDQAAYKQFGNSDKLNFSIEERDDEAIGNDKTLLSLLLLTKTARKTRTSYVKMDKCARKNVNREDKNEELMNGEIQISDDAEKKISSVSVSDQSKEWRTTASWQKGSTKYVDEDLFNADSRPKLDCKLPDYKKQKIEVDEALSNASGTEHLDYDAWGQLLKASEVLSSSKIKIETHCPNPF